MFESFRNLFMINVEFLDFGDFRKILSMLSELAKLEPTASSEFY